MGDCSEKFLKILVMVLSISFLVCGLVLLGYGIYLHMTLEGFSSITGNEIINPGMVMIVIGGALVIIAFVGYFGFRFENVCMLRTFASLIAFLLLFEVIIVPVVDLKQESIKEHMNKTIQDYKTSNDEVSKIWDTMQQGYECCGLEHPRDWDGVFPKSVPDSCCKEQISGCGKNARKDPDPKSIFGKGCYVEKGKFHHLRIHPKLSEDSLLLGALGGALLIIQLLAIIVSCCLARKIDN